MPEPVDIYTDNFQMTMSPYRVTINFSLTGAMPPAPGAAPQSERLASVRMSLEHLKLMAFIVHRQVMQYERGTGVTIQLPLGLLNDLHIGREDWEAFWPH